MSTVELKTDVHRLVDQLDDHFLKVVHVMLDTYLQAQKDPVIGYDVDGKPLLASVAKKKFKEQLEGVERGEYLTVEELEKESETW